MAKKWFLGILLVALVIPFPVQARPQRAVVDPPTLLTPEDDDEITYVSHPPLAIPNFSWEAVPETTQYEFQISSDIAFTTGNTKSVSTVNTRYTPDKALISSYLVDGEFYWRVRAKSPTVGPWSEERSFTKRWAFPSSEAPNRPALLAPAEGVTLQFLDQPGFSWQPLDGAAKYRLEIDDEQDFTTLVYYADNMPTTSHQPLSKPANGLYYWRVIPFDVANVRGAESEVRSFTMAYGIALADRPQQLAPANGSEPLFTPTFEWTALPGAQLYQLQYSTDETFQSGVTQVETRATSHSIDQLPNDVNMYWRVRAKSNLSFSEWSSTWNFEKHWYLQPQLLAPTNGYRHITEIPTFSWTPVPGAGYYKLTVACDQGFATNRKEASVLHTSYTMWDWSKFPDCPKWYWKVTPYHSNDEAGKDSAVWNFDLELTGANPAPQVLFPAFYYNPDLYVPAYGAEATSEVRTNPTAALPIFGWALSPVDYDPLGYPTRLAEQYRLEVDDSPTFLSPNWVVTTTNAVATPDMANPFTPVAGVDYYWRVRALHADGTPYSTSPTTGWSQRWVARFDASLGLAPRTATTPLVLRPTYGDQGVESMPLLEWWPIAGATRYKVEIARDAAFTRDLLSAWAQYPAYAYPGAMDYGTYYWRVQAWNATTALGSWSATQRFQRAVQSRWRAVQLVPMILDNTRMKLTGNTAAGTPGDLANLYAGNDLQQWVFGFDVVTGTQTVNYVLLVDSNQTDGSGAATDPVFNKPIATAHRPEYAIYLRQGAGAPGDGYFTMTEAFFYRYNTLTQQWDVPEAFDTVGDFYFRTSATSANIVLDGFVQVQIGVATLGAPGSLSVALLTADDSGTVMDALPTDNGGELDTFISLSEVPMLMAPPTNLNGDPSTHPTLPTMRWQPQVDTWEYRYSIQIARDSAFSSIAHARVNNLLSRAYIVPDNDIDGDNTYYWRVAIVHKEGVTSASQFNPIAWRLERKGFVAPNPQVTVFASTVTFSWGKVEGVGQFRLEFSPDPNFATSVTRVDVVNWRYTPKDALSPNTYYWRVRPVNWKGEAAAWTNGQSFTITLPTPTGLQALPLGISPRTPTLEWEPLLLPSTTPRFNAYRYRVQICENDAMTQNCEIVTTEQHSWTPPETFNDGTLFWRVYTIDGSGNTSSWTPVQSLTKQYPTTTLIAPTQGAAINEAPTFIWSIVPGMAYYRIEVADNPNFSPIAITADTAASRYTPVKAMTPKLYYWRVCARDRDSKSGPCTGATLYLDPNPYRIYLPLTLRNKS